MSEQQPPFWKVKTLSKMTRQEWESLCDRCGKCCVLKLEDVDSGDIFSTDVGCRLLDCATACCQNYDNRKTYVPDCTEITPDNIHELHWLPASCSYKLLAENKPLPAWHPLRTGDIGSTQKAGQSVAGLIFPEDAIDEEDMVDHIYKWD